MSKKETAPGGIPAQAMYIGPTLLRPVLLSHRGVYSGELPQSVKQLAAKDPDLAGCFVPLAEAGKALRELEGYPGALAGEHSRRYLSVKKRYLEGGAQ